jgi:hypothetical protein
MASKTEVRDDITARWEREATGYERQAEDVKSDLTPIDRKLLQMHARVKRGCANELRIEMRRITRG